MMEKSSNVKRKEVPNRAGHPGSAPAVAGRESGRRMNDVPVATDRRKTSDRRMAERVMVDMEVDYSSEETFLFANTANITNLSSLGIFVETRDPAPVGTRLNLRFVPPNAEEPLIIEGEVTWVNPFRADAARNINPGMGIRFVNLDLEEREILVSLVRRIAFLPDDD